MFGGPQKLEVYLAAKDAEVIGPYQNIFHFDLTKWVIPGTGNIRDYDLALATVVFTNTHYGVNNFNNEIKFLYNFIGPYTTFVPIGNYTITDLLTAVGNEMSLSVGIPGKFTLTENPLTSTVTLTVGGGDTCSLLESDNSLLDDLGFTDFGVDGVSHSGSDPFDISGPSAIIIQSNVSQYSLHSSGGSVFAEIPISHGFGYQVLYMPSTLNFFPLTNNVGYLEFSLIDSKSMQPFTLSKATDLRFHFIMKRRSAMD